MRGRAAGGTSAARILRGGPSTPARPRRDLQTSFTYINIIIMGIRRLRFCCPKGCWAWGTRASPNRSSWVWTRTIPTMTDAQSPYFHMLVNASFACSLYILHGGRKDDCIFHVNGWRRHDPCQCLGRQGVIQVSERREMRGVHQGRKDAL